MRRWHISLFLVTVAVGSSASRCAELLDAVPLCAGEQQIDVQRAGHAAPCVADFDGDGVRDLLIGEMLQGRLRIYRNAGTDARPDFRDFSVFQGGALQGRVPAG